jgi:hypothetical protein
LISVAKVCIKSVFIHIPVRAQAADKGPIDLAIDLASKLEDMEEPDLSPDLEIPEDLVEMLGDLQDAMPQMMSSDLISTSRQGRQPHLMPSTHSAQQHTTSRSFIYLSNTSVCTPFSLIAPQDI